MVFGWFDYDYATPGAVTASSLVAPEGSLLTPGNIVNFLNPVAGGSTVRARAVISRAANFVPATAYKHTPC